MSSGDDADQQRSAWLSAIRTSLPALALDDELVTAALARAAQPTEPLGEELVISVALAAMAAAGSEAAMEEIERRHDATIRYACHRFAGRDHSIEDLRQILRTALFVATSRSRPKIAEFNGRGSLNNWLRVTAVRIFIDLLRRKDRTREALGADTLPEPLAAIDLALDAIKAEHRQIVAGALREAVEALSPGTRLVLRLHLVQGASIDQVGATLGLHRATAARRIARARDELIESTRRLVSARLEIPDRELDDVCGLVVTGIDVSMRALLATPRPRTT